MAEQVNNQPSNPAPPPAAEPPAPPAEMRGHEYQEDPDLPDQGNELLEVFGPDADWSQIKEGLESKLRSRGGEGGQASDAPGAPAAEGSGEAAPAPAPPTPPAPPAAGASPLPQSAPAAPTPAAAAAPAPAAPPSANAEVQALKAQVEALLKQINQPQGTTGQQPQAKPSNSPAPTEGPAWAADKELLEYRYAIPSDVLAAIDSEDPRERSQGLHHLVNSFAQVTHSRVMEHVDRYLGSRLSDFSSQLTVTQQHQEMNRDYYSAFPDHQSPGNMVVVAQEAQAMWQENPTLVWNADSRNALGARVNAKLGLAAPQPAAEPAPQPPAPAPAKPGRKPAAMTGATTRASQPNGADPGSEIRDVLNSFG